MKRLTDTQSYQSYEVSEPGINDFLALIGHIIATLLMISGGWLVLAATMSFFTSPKNIHMSSKQNDFQIEYKEKSGEINAKTLSLINEHLKMAKSAEEMRQEFVRIENSLKARIISQENIGAEDYAGAQNNYPMISLSQEDHLEQFKRDLGETRERDQSPQGKIEGNIAKKEWLARYDQAYSEQYLQTFIENARRNGYKVKLNNKWEIISIKKIRKPKPVLF